MPSKQLVGQQLTGTRSLTVRKVSQRDGTRETAPFAQHIRLAEQQLIDALQNCSRQRQAVHAQHESQQSQPFSRRQAILLGSSLATASQLLPTPASAAETMKPVGIESTELVELGHSGKSVVLAQIVYE